MRGLVAAALLAGSAAQAQMSMPGRGQMAAPVLREWKDVEAFYISRHHGFGANMMSFGLSRDSKWVCSLMVSEDKNWSFICQDKDGDYWVVKQGHDWAFQGTFKVGDPG